jgi:hypothetical protein
MTDSAGKSHLHRSVNGLDLSVDPGGAGDQKVRIWLPAHRVDLPDKHQLMSVGLWSPMRYPGLIGEPVYLSELGSRWKTRACDWGLRTVSALWLAGTEF